MKTFRILLSILPLLLAPPPAGAEAPPAPSVPRLAYRERTLGNGLRVVSLVDAASPTAAVQVWYHVGSKDDPHGRSGFAHLFEHLMFKATANMKDETFDRLTEDVGGWNNAFTADDVTVYQEEVPSNRLEAILWAEADRLSSLRVDERVFRSERDVVKEEFRQRYLAPPYGKLYYTLEIESFRVHPYRRPGIGSLEDLDAASVEDVRAFHRTFYRPDNATLVVVGDFDPAALDRWVDRYFGAIPRPDTAIPRVSTREPERTAERRTRFEAPAVPLPAVAISYLLPAATDRDADVARIVQTLLATGDSSRLRRSLVEEQQVASEVDATADLREDASLFFVQATLAGGKSAAEGESALVAELEKLRTADVPEAELEKARAQELTSAFRRRQTADGKALLLGEAAVIFGDVERANRDLGILAGITAADVRRFAERWLRPENRLILHYIRKPDPIAEKKPEMEK